MTDAPTYDRARLKARLEQEEGRRVSVYKDTRGYLTVGIGHNLSIPQTPFVVDAIFDCDLVGCEKSLDARFPWWRSLDPVRQSVMLDLVFNMGGGALATFTNTLEAIESGDYRAAAKGLMASRWAEQVGHRAVVLSNMMLTGVEM